MLFTCDDTELNPVLKSKTPATISQSVNGILEALLRKVLHKSLR